MTPGSIVHVEQSNEIIYGVVLQKGEKKVHLVTERGRRLSCPQSKIHQATEETIELRGTDHELARRVRDFRREVEEAAATISVEELWEFLVSEGEKLSLREIVELYFGEEREIGLFAMRLALASDTIYFERRKDAYRPRKPEVVEKIKAREAALRRRAERLGAAAEWLGRALSGKGVREEEIAGEVIELLRGLAVFGEEFPRYREGVRLLEAVGHATKYIEEVAAELLIAIGVWEEDENHLLLRHQISREYPTRALHELDEICRKVAAGRVPPSPSRADLRGLFTVTIDDEETLDIDDALSLEPRGSGWRLYIHITDVADVIPEGGELDAFAAQRAATIYLPEERIPMFPPQLSEDLLSLRAGALRPAVTFFADFDEGLDLVEEGILSTQIRVDERWDYEGVNEALAGGGERGAWLRRLLAITDRLREGRIARGAVTIHRPEIKVRVRDGEIELKRADTGSPSHRLVSETMILANTIAARFCIANDLPAVYRVQPPPENDVSFEGIDLSDPYVRYRIYSRMRPSTNATIPDPHRGLGVEAYAQASSPIRRYHDLVMQRQIATFLAEGRPRYSREEILEVIATAEEGIAAVRTFETARKRYWFLRHLRGRIEQPHEAVILRQQNRGRYLVQLTEYELNIGCVLNYELNPGDRVRLFFSEVNPRRDQIVVRDVIRGEEEASEAASLLDE